MRRGAVLGMVCWSARSARGLVAPWGGLTTTTGSSGSRRVVVRTFAKKGGGKKKKQPKQSGIGWAKNFVVYPYDSVKGRELAELACGAYSTRTGKPVHESVVGAGDVPKALWKAPVFVAMVRETDAGAEFAYVNAAACEALSEGLPEPRTFDKVIGTPTTLPTSTAKPYESGYTKKLDSIILTGAARWSLDTMAVVDGTLKAKTVAVAYTAPTWTLEDGTVCAPGGVRRAPDPSPGDLAQAIDAQAAAVRRLKEEDGLTNKDPAVVAAVAELLRLKAKTPEPAPSA